MDIKINFNQTLPLVTGLLLFSLACGPVTFFLLLRIWRAFKTPVLRTDSLTSAHEQHQLKAGLLDDAQISLAMVNLCNIVLFIGYLKLSLAWLQHLNVMAKTPNTILFSIPASQSFFFMLQAGLGGAVCIEFLLMCSLVIFGLLWQSTHYVRHKLKRRTAPLSPELGQHAD